MRSSYRFRPSLYFAATLSLSGATLGAASAQAQQAPDAGQIQRQIERSLPAPGSQPAPVPVVPPQAPVDRSGPTMPVDRFVVEGATLIPAEELERQLDSYRGKPLTLDELKQAAQGLASYYRERGWFVRVLLPEQGVSSGTLRIVIVEARFGEIVGKSGDTRANTAFVERMIGRHLHAGEPYSLEDLERGLLLANDLPGIEAEGVLQAGTRPGTSDLAVTITDGPRAALSLAGNNFGNRYTGRAQGTGVVAVDNLTGYGDQLTGALLMADHMDYQAAGYSVPLGTDGLRARVDVDQLHYRLGKDFEDLDAKGEARSVRAGLVYPLVRSGQRNMWVSLNYAHRRTEDRALGTTLRERRIDSYTLGLYGDAQSSWTRYGGAMRWSVELTGGHADLRNQTDRAVDEATARVDAGFTRLNLQWQRDQYVAAGTYLRARASAQLADSNLESSQQFSLGGPFGVRGYPMDEGTGDMGAVLQLEAHTLMGWTGIDGLDGFAFLDAGVVRQRKDPWSGWDQAGLGRNSYALYSAGLGLAWSHPRGFTAQATVALPFGANPGSTDSDRNQDGSHKGPQFWLNISQVF